MGITKWFEAAANKLLDMTGIASVNTHFPWLILPHSKRSSIFRTFSNIFTRRSFHLQLTETTLESRYCGTSNGCLLIFNDSTSQILVLNPLKEEQQFLLPPITNIFDQYCSPNPSNFSSDDGYSKRSLQVVFKAVLSSVPTFTTNTSTDAPEDKDCAAMAIFGESRKLALYKPENKTWTVLKDSASFYEDVIFYDGKFYAVSECGRVVVCDVNDDQSEPTLKELAPPWFFWGKRVYLVGTTMGLLLVIRFLEDDEDDDSLYKTTYFTVYKLDWATRYWSRVRSLDSWMLFLGQNQSLCLPLLDSNTGGNFIYFTDDYVEGYVEGEVGGHDAGIFDLEDGSIELLPGRRFQDDSQLIWPPSMWIMLSR